MMVMPSIEADDAVQSLPGIPIMGQGVPGTCQVD